MATVPEVFPGMCIAGTFSDWKDVPMTPCSASADNHDWYIVQEFAAGDKVKIKDTTESWTYNCGGTPVEVSDGFYVYGVQNGSDIFIENAVTYLIVFNDITRYIRFIKK